MSDIEYIQRGYETNLTEYLEQGNNIKLEIIRHNPYNYFISSPKKKGKITLTNTKETTYNGLRGWTSKDNKSFSIKFNYNSKEASKYTFDILWAKTGAGQYQITLNNKKQGLKKATIKDTQFQRIQTTQKLIKGNNTITLQCTKNMIIVAVHLRKLDYYTGTADNSFDYGTKPLTVTKFNIKQAGDYEISELSAEIFYSKAYEDKNTSTNLVFDYRDEINVYIKNTSGKFDKPVFGGYISNANADDKLTTITLNCASRLKDADLRKLTTDIVLANGESDSIKKSYTNYSDILLHLLLTIETPIQHNISSTRNTELKSRKTGLNSPLTKKHNGKKVKVKKMVKKVNKTNIILQNKPNKKVTGGAVLWDQIWNKENVNIKNYPTFYIKYGLGEQLKTTYVRKKLKSGKYSKKKTKVTTGGFDKDKPFQGYIRVQFSYDYTNKKGTLVKGYSRKAKRLNAYIDFTKEYMDVSYKLGDIKPVFSYNTIREGNLNIYNLLSSATGKTNIYLKQIAILNKNGNDALYDKQNKKSSCKIVITSTGLKKGSEINPESLGTSGKTVLESLKTVGEKSEYHMKLDYGSRRHSDTAIFFLNTKTSAKMSFREDTNILELSDVKAKAVETLVNNSVKVYKSKKSENSDKTVNKFTTVRDLDSIIRYGEHTDIEVLSDQVGSKMAYYLAKNDPDRNTELTYSYTITVNNYYPLIIGDFVECVFSKKYLNDIKTVESVEIDYDPSTRPVVSMKCGMDQVARNMRIKKGIEKNRKVARSKNITFYGGAEWDDSIENMEW
ncbi:MAG: hypothetical protein ISP01_05195 [Methanobrevibacter arboriphilus]|uniref:Uncharacterized protein n=1 Tax=Methanobrevibacter arboriphilus TaxID=39441 RepID=A0A843AFV7_METAZ|nr:hypothetical protein [Methanobrevibacter arboriphilus]MBF4468783.1 hypothetical protein [Methanobrevibacter arboriphilus]